MVARNLLLERNYQNFGGVNTTSAKTNLNPNEASDINNGDLTTTGSVVKRQGIKPLNGVAWNTNKIRLIQEYVRDGYDNQIIAYGANSGNTSGAIAQLSGACFATGSFFTEIISLTAIRRPSFVQFGDLFFVYNGTTDRTWDGTTARRIGIVKPTGGCTLGQTASGGYLGNGDYIVGYTYRNSTTGAESNRSSLTTVTVNGGGTSQVIDVSVVLPGTATTADQIRVYRTIANGNTLFYEKDLAITATTATLGDTAAAADSVIIVNVLAENDNDLPPASSIAHKIANRIFMRSETSKNDVYFTKVSSQHGSMPQSVPAENYAQCDPDDGDIVVAINDANGIPVVLKERSFGRLLQTAQNTYIYKKIADVECLGHHCVAKKEQNLVWLSRSNCNMSDGMSVIKVGNPIETTIRGMNSTSGTNFSGILAADKQQVRFSVCDDNVGTNGECDLVLVGDYKLSQPQLNWTFYRPAGSTYPSVQAACFGTRIGSDNSIQQLFGNAVGNGFAYQMDTGYTDKVDWSTNYGIYFEYVTRWIDYGMDSTKLFKYINAKFNSSTGGNSTLFIGAQYNYVNTITSVKDVSLNVGQTIWADASEYTAKWGEQLWAADDFFDINCYLQKKAKQTRIVFRNSLAGIAIEVLGYGVYAGRMPFK